jgi:hypothetical protein
MHIQRQFGTWWRRQPRKKKNQIYDGRVGLIVSRNLARIEIEKEVKEDKIALEKAFAYHVEGMAYPFGDFSDEVVSVLKKTGVKYARTVISNHKFEIQTDLLRFEPTCHHNDRQLPELMEIFLSLSNDTPQIFYIWGHSWEFDGDANWDYFESICKALSNHQDIFYGTNKEVLLNETDRIGETTKLQFNSKRNWLAKKHLVDDVGLVSGYAKASSGVQADVESE